MACAPSQLVPQGPGIDPAHQGCVIAGAAVNAKTVSGDAYIGTDYTYTRARMFYSFYTWVRHVMN